MEAFLANILHLLRVLDELKTITKYFPEIPLQTLLTWATKNGAEFLGFNHLGTIEKGCDVPRMSTGPDINHVILGSEGFVNNAFSILFSQEA